MQFVLSSPIAGLVLFLVMYLEPPRALCVLFMCFPLGATAAFVVSGAGSLTLMDLAALGFAVNIAVRFGVSEFWGVALKSPAVMALLLLLMIASLGVRFLPHIFAGMTEVYAITQEDGRNVITAISLHEGSGGLGQLVRFYLGAITFISIFVWARRGASIEDVFKAICAMSLVHLVVSFVDWIGYPLGLENVMAPFRTVSQAILSDQQFPSIRRIIGGYTEPASFGLFTIGLVGLWMRLAFSKQRVVFAWLFTALMSALALRSTSSATMLNFVLLSLIMLVWQWRAVANQKSSFFAVAILMAASPGLYAITAIALGYSPLGTDIVDTLIWDKTVSESGVERLSWNLQAFQNFSDTYGLGVGIGAARTSSWLTAVLSNLGLPGLLVFAAFLWWVFRTTPGTCSGQFELASALRWGCLAILLQSCLTKPFPDLGIPFFAMAALAVGFEARRRGQRPRQAARLMASE